MLRLSFCLLVLAALLLAGCSKGLSKEADVRTITDADNGKQLELAVGEEIKLALPSNPTTGYTWELKAYDVEQLKLVKEGFDQPASSKEQTGAGGTQWWRFQVIAPGKAGLDLAYRRSFEKDKPPLQTFMVSLNVTGEAPQTPESESKSPHSNPHGM